MRDKVEILVETRNRLANPDAWVKGVFAIDKDGIATEFDGDQACSWCLSGAIFRECGFTNVDEGIVPKGIPNEFDWRYHEAHEEQDDIFLYIAEAILEKYPDFPKPDHFYYYFELLTEFNDSDSISHPDVIAVLDDAIERAKGECND